MRRTEYRIESGFHFANIRRKAFCGALCPFNGIPQRAKVRELCLRVGGNMSLNSPRGDRSGLQIRYQTLNSSITNRLLQSENVRWLTI